jgi:hypothetical protein
LSTYPSSLSINQASLQTFDIRRKEMGLAARTMPYHAAPHHTTPHHTTPHHTTPHHTNINETIAIHECWRWKEILFSCKKR